MSHSSNIRWLLVIALVLNGMMTAQAAVHALPLFMHAGVSVGQSGEAMAAASAADMNCHDETASVMPATQDHPVDACCQDGACQCACAAQLPAAEVRITSPAPASVPVVVNHVSYTSPCPPLLLRPPIA